MYNYIVIISLIIFLFFISADPKVTRNIVRKNSIHIIFFLLLIYFVYNNLHLGFFLLIIVVIILYYTNFRHFFLHYIRNPSDLKNWREMFTKFSWDSIMEGIGDILNDDESITTSEINSNSKNQFLVNHSEKTEIPITVDNQPSNNEIDANNSIYESDNSICESDNSICEFDNSICESDEDDQLNIDEFLNQIDQELSDENEYEYEHEDKHEDEQFSDQNIIM